MTSSKDAFLRSIVVLRWGSEKFLFILYKRSYFLNETYFYFLMFPIFIFLKKNSFVINLSNSLLTMQNFSLFTGVMRMSWVMLNCWILARFKELLARWTPDCESRDFSMDRRRLMDRLLCEKSGLKIAHKPKNYTVEITKIGPDPLYHNDKLLVGTESILETFWNIEMNFSIFFSVNLLEKASW